MSTNLKAVVLAAGKGTRLQTEGVEIPKVMRLAAGKPLLRYVCDARGFIPAKDIVLVVGFLREQVIEAFPACSFAVQEQQLGTGHAVACAMETLRDFEGDVLVCCGDMPLLRRDTYRSLVEIHRAEGNACTLLTGTTDDALPYGRIVRGADGRFAAIVEEKDCTPEQRAIRELNSGVYLFRAGALRETLGRLRTDNAQGEYYLTDVPALLLAEGEKVGVCCRELGNEILGVNTPEQLELVGKLLAARG
jgi:bifunctional UDP-N-acetylglucosamine pyrophosphorylase/glucosamine-1-phosphate N-acetyltransferase/UDP-N-acetylglucosamine pyrophosphorylase